MGSDTGHGGEVTFATSGYSLDIISITPPEESVEDVALPHLGLTDGDHIPYMPGDLIEGGDLVLTCAYAPDTLASAADAPLRTVENITLTWPTKLTTAATWVFSGYVKSSSHNALETSTRLEVTLTVKVAGNITKNNAVT